MVLVPPRRRLERPVAKPLRDPQSPQSATERTGVAYDVMWRELRQWIKTDLRYHVQSMLSTSSEEDLDTFTKRVLIQQGRWALINDLLARMTEIEEEEREGKLAPEEEES